MGGQHCVGLEMVEIVTNQLGDYAILFSNLVHEDLDLILKVLDLSELGCLNNHNIIGTMHPFHSLSRKN